MKPNFVPQEPALKIRDRIPSMRRWQVVFLVTAVVSQVLAQVEPALASGGSGGPPKGLPPLCAEGDTSGAAFGVLEGTQCAVRFTSTEDAWQTFTVPSGVTSVQLEASGAYGGGFCTPYNGGGEPGGANGTLAVTDGEVIKVFVGFVGTNATQPPGTCAAGDGDGTGGYGGGGDGGLGSSADGGGAGGGGGTFVEANGALQLLAGGGGGTGEGGESGGYLEPGITVQFSGGHGGSGGGGTDQPDGNDLNPVYTGAPDGFDGQSDPADSRCTCPADSGGGGASPRGPGEAGAPLGTVVSATRTATDAPGQAGAGPASYTDPSDVLGGAGGGSGQACSDTSVGDPTQVVHLYGGRGGGGYYGGGGGGCGVIGGAGGGGGSSYAAPDLTAVSFSDLANPRGPIWLTKEYGVEGGNAISGVAEVIFPACATDVEGGTGTAAFVPAGSTASTNGCQLNVTIKPLQSLRAGLAVDNGSPHEGPANFTTLTASRAGSAYAEPVQAGQKCESGCINLLVTVTDAKTNKPVSDAKVEASLSEAAFSYSNGQALGTDFLCAQSDQEVLTCSKDLTGLTTDDNGQLHLLYWVPGLAPQGVVGSVPTWSSDISVVATKDCDNGVCRHAEGANDFPVVAQPYIIYQHSGQLSRKVVELLIEMYEEGSSFLSGQAKELAYDRTTEPLIEQLEKLEAEAVASALKSAGPAIAGIHFVYEAGESVFKSHKQYGLIAALLTALNMPGVGIGVDNPFEQEVPDTPSSAFMDALLAGLGNTVAVGRGGALWSDAEALAEQAKSAGKAFAVQPENVTLKVYETSYCNLDNPDCGPGYKGSPGIKPNLCFYFTGSTSFPEPLRWQAHFCEPYDASAFVWTQKGLNKSLPASLTP